ncbi:MAG: hypothetical protein DMD91_26215 [Candidatus Rokuibacteriota bacterium]|nr:MAG: hypothetical protein DMD91_26215 [Candidatus Rokubacteria bacterium]
MAGDNLNVWYDPEGDHLEIVFDEKTGYFEDSSLENVMQKRDAEGNLLAISIFNLSSFAGTRRHPESTSGHDLWAVFNLDVDDPDSFEFDVALGYERLEDTEPESTSVIIARADACARCSVFFHADRPSSRLVERTLEIIHKRLSSPVVSSGVDPVSPVSLVSLCRDQLALALRLFQSQSFLMFPRERRHEERARAYLALIGRQAGAPAPYVLQGHQVTRFLEFARKLHIFHVDRNLYRCIRRDPLGPDLLATMRPDDPAGAKFFKRVAKLMVATDLFEQANEVHALSDEMRLLWLVMAAEALFTDDDKSELSYRLATRMAFLNGAGVEDVKRQWELVRSMYEARSKLMHGTAYVGKPSKRLPGLVGDAGFIEPIPERLLAFNNLVRASILYFIAFQDDRRDVLETLDRSVFDPSEVASLRRIANEYWGLTGREDEMLCSGRWVA